MHIGRLIYSVGLLSVLAACGQKTKSSETVLLPISVEQVGGASELNLDGGLALMGTGISDFKINVTGCKSGYTKSVTSTAAAPESRVALYKFDVQCVAGLQEFTVGGQVYTKVGGGDLTTGSAIFTAGPLELSVSVASQFDSPLTSAGKAEFKFYEIRKGTDHTPVAANYSEGHDLTVSGVEAPNFEINQVLLSAVAATDGAPTYQVKFECQQNVATSKCPTPGGDNQALSAMDMKLVEDTFSGTITYSQAQTIFASAGTAGTEDGAIGTHGGMKSDLVGPAPLYTKRNMLAVIRFSDGGGGYSFRYFNLDIGEPAL